MIILFDICSTFTVETALLNNRLIYLFRLFIFRTWNSVPGLSRFAVSYTENMQKKNS